MAVQTGGSQSLLDVGLASKPAPVRWYLQHERLVLGLISFAGFFALWELGAGVGVVSTYFFSAPILILAAAVKFGQTAIFWTDVRVSLTELLVGYVTGAILGIVAGLVIGWYRRLNLLIDPWLNFFYSLPKIAIIPIMVLWFGLNMRSVIAAVIFGTFLTVLINTLHGVHTVERRFLDVATSFRASRRRVFMTVIVPSTVPFIVAGLRLGVGSAMIGVFVGELFASTSAGLGYFIDNFGDVAEATPMLFGIIVFTLIGASIIGSLRLLERRFQQWRPNARAI
ncbi:MAG TPA: ABC transporter permease [Chloroflexota bacterium]|nr:ABC transporter permease [Chloroflexota bacterium]